MEGVLSGVLIRHIAERGGLRDTVDTFGQCAEWVSLSRVCQCRRCMSTLEFTKDR